MCSNTQPELYAQFEPDANEILLGQRTQPDRPLTDQEVSKRRKIILKLVDQKLKFDLIELLSRQQQQQTNTSNVHASYSAITSFDTNDRTISTNYVRSQHTYHPDPECIQQHFQPQFGNVWQPTIFHQQYDIPANATWSHEIYNYRPNLQFPKQSRDEFGVGTSSRSKNLKQSLSNLIHLSTEPLPKPKCSSTNVSFKKNSTPTLKPVNQFRQKYSSTSHGEPRPHSIVESTTLQEPLPSDKPLNKPKDRLREEKYPFREHQEICPSNSDETKVVSTNFAFTECQPDEIAKQSVPTAGIRKREHSSSSKPDFPKKFSLFNEKTKSLDAAITNKTSGTKTVIDVKNIASAGGTGTEGKKRKSTNRAKEWSDMHQLVTRLFPNGSNNCKRYSPRDLQLKNEFLVQMTFSPDALRSNTEFVKNVGESGWLPVKEFIFECKRILANLSRADPKNQALFAKLRSKLIENVKASQEADNFRSAYSKVSSLISSFSCVGENHQNLIIELMKNPHALESKGIIKDRNVGVDVMKGIKAVLDSFISPKLPKKIYLPLSRYVDVPFVVNLYDKTMKMTEIYANELKTGLFESIDCLRINPKPSFRDFKFKDDSLEIVCVNNASFEWLEKAISNHLGVSVRPVKNVIAKDGLKTICLEFERPQYLHFNYLMEQLKADNPRLLTRRWELRSSQQKKIFDPTKRVYVGVDVDSLIILEEMNRVGKFEDSTVQFKISYCNRENNFEKMNIVKEEPK